MGIIELSLVAWAARRVRSIPSLLPKNVLLTIGIFRGMQPEVPPNRRPLSPLRERPSHPLEASQARPQNGRRGACGAEASRIGLWRHVWDNRRRSNFSEAQKAK